MPIMKLQIKFTDEERALLQEMAERNGMTEADYLRVCMIVDGVMSGNKQAIKITAGRLREKVGRRVADLLGLRFEQDAPSKA